MARVKKTKAERKNAPHFNIVDAMIVILVIAAVVGIYFRYNIIDFLTKDKSNDEYVVSFTVENVKYTTPEYYIDVGDIVYFKSNGDVLGELISDSKDNPVEVGPASENFVRSDGEIVEVYYPDKTRVDFSGRLLCEGSYTSKGGFCIGGTTYIAPGQNIEVYTERVSFVLSITSIDLYQEG